MDVLKKVDLGRALTIAGLLITVAASLVEGEQQKQANHEIALEVAAMLRKEMKEGEL